MIYNKFYYRTLFRVLLIFATLFALTNIFLRPDLLFTQIILVTIILLQIAELTRFVNRTNYDLGRFLAAIKDGDFSINFNAEETSQSFISLHSSFSQLVETLREMETENAAQFHFLNKLVDQIDFGIITLDKNDEIELINQHALALLDIPQVRNWRKIKNPNTKFLDELLLLNNVNNELIEVRIADQTRYFSVNLAELSIRDEPYKIVSFQDIKSEIQQKEIEAWHKLIRILTHEIMNSVTPLVSLAETLQLILQNEDGTVKIPKELDEENVEDLNSAVGTIKERSEGILKFVKDYRKLTRIPKPEFNPTDLPKLTQRVANLMKPMIEDHMITLNINIPPLQVYLDSALIDQVLINLVKNAIEALKETNQPTIELSTRQTSEQFYVNVQDNGPGVDSDKIDRIFVPFYTSKSDGSGIGLSVSRQIMNLHDGYLEVNSTPGKSTTFSLVFPIKRLAS